METHKTTTTTKIDITWKSLARCVAMIALVFITIRLASFLTLLFIALLLAVSFDLIVQRMVRYRIPRPVAYGLVIVGTIAIMAGVGIYLVPAMAAQLQGVGENLPKIRQELMDRLPEGAIQKEAMRIWSHPEALVGNLPEKVVSLGSLLVGGLSATCLAIVFAFYFMMDGRRTLDWIISFFGEENQHKLRLSAAACSTVISAYVTGQIVTSVCVALFVGIDLWLLKVPGALLLAVMAGILDIVPVIGVTLTIVVGCLVALSVSGTAVLLVFLTFLFYHGVENYLLVPKVYGAGMRLSSLVVLLAVVVGGLVGGTVGIVIALPLAAAYPAMEKIWLKKYLGEEVVEQHEELTRAKAK